MHQKQINSSLHDAFTRIKYKINAECEICVIKEAQFEKEIKNNAAFGIIFWPFILIWKSDIFIHLYYCLL
jgi:hypothetical protein